MDKREGISLNTPVSSISIELNKVQKLRRAYGIWWDIINTATAIFLLFVLFCSIAILLIVGKTEMLPLADSLWKQFTDVVSLERQTEIGLSMLGISISGFSAASLYLIRVGTARWAMNRRIGQIHFFYAQAIHHSLSSQNPLHADVAATLEAFINGSMNVFEQISETHARAQVYFELARMRAHLFVETKKAPLSLAEAVAVDLFCAALICQKKITLFSKEMVFKSVILEALDTSPRAFPDVNSLHPSPKKLMQGDEE